MTPCESWPTRLAPTIWRMTRAASASGVPAAMNSARPISSRRSAGIFGIVEFLPRASGAGEDVRLGEEIGDVAQRLLFRLARHIDAAARHVFRRLHLQERRLEAAELVLLVHMLHPERDPADARFEEGDAQLLIFFEKAAVDHGGAGEQLLRRMRAGVDLQKVLEMSERVERVAARGVERDRDALLRAFLVEGPEVAMRDVAAAVIGVDHDADRAEL